MSTHDPRYDRNQGYDPSPNLSNAAMDPDDPDAIRADIEATRQSLSNDVNALAEQARPSTIAKNQVNKVQGKVSQARDALFGSPHDPYDDGKVGELGDAVSDKAHDVKDALTPSGDTGRRLTSATRGRPLVTGLVALALGALVGSLAPSSKAEQRAANDLRDKAQPLMDDATGAAEQSLANLKEPAQQSMEDLKDHAAGAGDRVKQSATDEGHKVQDRAVEAKDAVKESGDDTGRPSH